MVDLTVQSQGSGSTVMWGMHAPIPSPNRPMTVFFDKGKTVGKDFEAGPENLKSPAQNP
jgi:hypothetical protein